MWCWDVMVSWRAVLGCNSERDVLDMRVFVLLSQMVRLRIYMSP